MNRLFREPRYNGDHPQDTTDGLNSRYGNQEDPYAPSGLDNSFGYGSTQKVQEDSKQYPNYDDRYSDRGPNDQYPNDSFSDRGGQGGQTVPYGSYNPQVEETYVTRKVTTTTETVQHTADNNGYPPHPNTGASNPPPYRYGDNEDPYGNRGDAPPRGQGEDPYGTRQDPRYAPSTQTKPEDPYASFNRPNEDPYRYRESPAPSPRPPHSPASSRGTYKAHLYDDICKKFSQACLKRPLEDWKKVDSLTQVVS